MIVSQLLVFVFLSMPRLVHAAPERRAMHSTSSLSAALPLDPDAPPKASEDDDAALSATYKGPTPYLRCPRGKFIDRGTICADCPSGKYQPLPDQSSCRSLHLCPLGRYHGGSAGLCLVCPTGRYGFAPKSTMVADANTCKLCPAGRFQRLGGATQCWSCPSGKHQAGTGQTKCFLCPAGQYNQQHVTGTSGCLGCPPQWRQPQPGQSTCIPGSTPTHSPTPSPSPAPTPKRCEPGFRPLHKKKVVDPDAPALIVEDVGVDQQVKCYRCNPGQFQPVLGGLRCRLCPPGKFAADYGSSRCLACPPGRVQHAARGTSCVAGAALQARVKDARARARAAHVAQTCPAGKFSPSSVPKNSKLAAFFVMCHDCPSGKYLAASTRLGTPCTACLPGQHQYEYGQSHCDVCPAGKFTATAGRARCDGTGTGNASGNGSGRGVRAASLRQHDCPAGKFGSADLDGSGGGTGGEDNSGVRCVACPSGKYQAHPHELYCEKCMPGRFQDAWGQSGCQECPAGKNTRHPGRDHCEVIAGVAQRAACRDGYFHAHTLYDWGEGCKPCPPGKFQRYADSCVHCAPGRYQPSGAQITCLRCPFGKYQPLSGKPSCVIDRAQRFCPPGKYRRKVLGMADETVCARCGGGHYQPRAGQLTCLRCARGRVAAATREMCLGSARAGPGSGSGSGSGGTGCVAGTYLKLSASRPHVPRSAADGDSSSEVGDTLSPDYAPPSCEYCRPGHFQPSNGQDFCEPCPAQFFQADEGATTCTPCPAGKFSGKAAKLCSAICPPGRYSVAEACAPCEPGRFQLFARQSVCLSCPQGKYQLDQGGTKCHSCGGRVNAVPLSPAASVVCAEHSGPADRVKTSTSIANNAVKPRLKPSATSAKSPGASLAQLLQLAGMPLGTVVRVYEPDAASGKCHPRWPVALDGETRALPQPGVLVHAPQGPRCVVHACVDGEYASRSQFTDAIICKPCPAGKYQSIPSGTVCSTCPGASVGSSSCVEHSNVVQSSRLAVPPLPLRKITQPVQRQRTSRASASQATASGCAPGSRKQLHFSGTITCVPCEPGKYQPLRNRPTCAHCAAGNQNIHGAVTCRNREPLLYYKYNRGQQGRSHVPNAAARRFLHPTAGVGCPAGSYQEATPHFPQPTVACVACPPGRYTPRAGFGECFACAPGEGSGGAGAIRCVPLGSLRDEADMEAQRQARVAAAAHAAEAAEALQAVPATQATVATKAKQVTMLPTRAHTVSSARLLQKPSRVIGAPIVEPVLGCPLGRFMVRHFDEVKMCAMCPNGKFAPGRSLTRCFDCPVGRLTADSGSFCTTARRMPVRIAKPGQCPAGTFSTVVGADPGGNGGQHVCIDCPVGKYKPAPVRAKRSKVAQSNMHNSRVPLWKNGRLSWSHGRRLLPSDVCLPCSSSVVAGATRCASHSRRGHRGGSLSIHTLKPKSSQPHPPAHASVAALAAAAAAGALSQTPGTLSDDPANLSSAEQESVAAAIAAARAKAVAELTKCKPGQHFKRSFYSDKSWCFDCEPGRFRSASMLDCATCPTGRFAREPGSTRCTAPVTPQPTPRPGAALLDAGIVPPNGNPSAPAAFPTTAPTPAPTQRAANCNRLTDGTCVLFHCAQWRHARCVGGKCECGDGRCSEWSDQNAGFICIKTAPTSSHHLISTESYVGVAPNAAAQNVMACPVGCSKWFDGCNVCECKQPGVVGRCVFNPRCVKGAPHCQVWHTDAAGHVGQ